MPSSSDADFSDDEQPGVVSIVECVQWQCPACDELHTVDWHSVNPGDELTCDGCGAVCRAGDRISY